MAKISIVIPTVLGNEKLLMRALSSLVKFKDPKHEYEFVIVANDWEGFSIPVNRGLKMATGEFVLIMNDDVEVQGSGWEDNFLKAFENLSVGIVGHHRTEQHDKRYSAMWFTMIKKTLFEELGYLDENMNLYSQDIDFGYRAMKAGYETSFAEAPIRHYTSSTTGRLAKEDNEEYLASAKKMFFQKYGVDHDSI